MVFAACPTPDAHGRPIGVNVIDPIPDLMVESNAPEYLQSLSAVFAPGQGGDPDVDYVAVEIDPTTGDPAAGTGVFAYSFTVHGNDGLQRSFATEDLVFTGNIRQVNAYDADLDEIVPVHFEESATTFDNTPGSGYTKSLDTWLCDDWVPLPPAFFETDLGLNTGNRVILNAGTPVLDYSRSLVYIVAGGDVEWGGAIYRREVRYDVSGTAEGDRFALSVTDNTNTDLVNAVVQDAYLRLSFADDETGQADITIRATDTEGAWAEDTFTVTVVPEPATLGLLVFGGIAILRRRRRK
jgi:hypothetical protein